MEGLVQLNPVTITKAENLPNVAEFPELLGRGKLRTSDSSFTAKTFFDVTFQKHSPENNM